MPQLKRRHFLQLAGSTLASIGLSQTSFLRQCDRYGKALAQTTPRKLALLVGINNYSKDIGRLYGCLTDVEMQYELLVHRFGFQPDDIQIISDPLDGILSDRVVASPTRDNILNAFETHLIDQAKPGDVVVFHYSGHGSLVNEANGIPEFNNQNGTLVPIDGRSSLDPNSNQVNDIMGKTLFLLTYALKTDNISLILDSCHSGGGTRGNLTIRSVTDRLLSGAVEPSDVELAYQDMWRERNGLSPQELKDLRQTGIARGMAFGSARINQLAADAPFGDFNAGAFTYLLTRYLWQQVGNQSVETAFVNLSRSTQDVAKSAGLTQEPVYQVAPNSNFAQQPPLFIAPLQPAAEAVVRQIDGTNVTFWLGGVSPQSLAAFTEGAVFNLIDGQGTTVGEVTQTGRAGLEGYGILAAANRSGRDRGILMREQVRGMPTDLSLRIGLDPSLAGETAAARDSLASVRRVTLVDVNQTQPVDYLLGRLTDSIKANAAAEGIAISSAIGSLGLLTPGLTPVAETFGRLNESVANAVARLRPRMKMLLAGRILKTLTNGETSNVNVTLEVTPVESGGALLSRGSRAAQETGLVAQTVGTGRQQVMVGDRIEIAVTNNETRNLYISIIVIDSKGDLIVLHPVDWTAAETATLVSPGQRLVAPAPNSDFKFEVGGPAGHFELLVLASTEQLRDALKGLREVARGRGMRAGDPLIFDGGQTRGSNEDEDSPVEVLGSLLGDLSRSARSTVFVRGRQSLDAKRLAAFSAVFEVVE